MAAVPLSRPAEAAAGRAATLSLDQPAEEVLNSVQGEFFLLVCFENFCIFFGDNYYRFHFVFS